MCGSAPWASSGLVAKVRRWYVIARNGPNPDDDVRTYRVDRIDSISTSEDFPPTKVDPAGAGEFDLIEYWNEHIKAIEAFRSSVAGTIRAPKWARPILQDHFGSYMTVTSEENESDGGHFIAEVRANLTVALAEQLAGWGRQVEVLGPPELRSELARIGAELACLYTED